MVLIFSQACTVKAESRLRLLNEASAISVCEWVCLTRLTESPRVHPSGMQRHRQQELGLCWGRQSPDEVLKTLSEQMRKADPDLKPYLEFELADELPDRFNLMKQCLGAVELRGVAQAVSTALNRPGALGQRFAEDCVAG